MLDVSVVFLGCIYMHNGCEWVYISTAMRVYKGAGIKGVYRCNRMRVHTSLYVRIDRAIEVTNSKCNAQTGAEGKVVVPIM